MRPFALGRIVILFSPGSSMSGAKMPYFMAFLLCQTACLALILGPTSSWRCFLFAAILAALNAFLIFIHSPSRSARQPQLLASA